MERVCQEWIAESRCPVKNRPLFVLLDPALATRQIVTDVGFDLGHRRAETNKLSRFWTAERNF